MKIARKWMRGLLIAGLCLASLSPVSAQTVHSFSFGQDSFLLDGKPFVIRCGEIHFARVPKEYWRQRLQMCKAMGLNTVCLYLFWNYHEWNQGSFDWNGDRDAAEFCRLAQEEGLWVILRPGPYACAEWEMGGLPWWLLKSDANVLRTRDPAFINPARAWIKEMGRVLSPLQASKGGPILMVQVENEYGYFGNDVQYIKDLRDAMTEAGFEVPFFACNPPHLLQNQLPPGILKVVNFGGNAAQAFETLRQVQPKAPLMCGEFYPGWFDNWGAPHSTGNLKGYLSNLEYMLKNNLSFSIYMAHGGTSFGLWAGAVGPKPGKPAFSPDTTSYDYDAPISEAGWVTPKFQATRDLITQYLPPEEKPPEAPAAFPVITIPELELQQTAPLFDNLPSPVEDGEPGTMEKYGQGRGCILYRTTLPPGPAGKLRAGFVHDFAWIYLDGKEAGTMDRRTRQFEIELPERSQAATLDILVEAMGRINFSQENHDRKGLKGPVMVTSSDGISSLTGWKIFPLNLENDMLENLKWKPSSEIKIPAFWKGGFSLTETGDTFLDLSTWGKGVAWINGHCLGRFWNIGPQQTLYLPAPWLIKGTNEVLIMDLAGPEKAVLRGLTKPILNQFRPNLDIFKKSNPALPEQTPPNPSQI